MSSTLRRAAASAALLLALARACTYEANTKLNNTAYVDTDGPRQADSAAECAGVCASTAGCSFYAWQNDPSVKGTQCRWATLTHCCWLHTSGAQPVRDATYTSGEVFDGTPCPPPQQPCINATQSECGGGGGGGGGGSNSSYCHCSWNATGTLHPPSAPFCDVSAAPYPLPGDENIRALVGPDTLLTPNLRWAVFGDSITWLGLYEAVLDAALAASPTTKGLNVSLINEGVNGGTASDLVLGFSPWGALVPNRTFADVIKLLQPDVVGIQIGINDVLQLPCGARCSNTSAFASILRTQLIDVARAAGAAVYVCSVTVIGEAPPFSSPTDLLLDSFARTAMSVAAEAGAPFVDLRDAYKDYDLAENCMHQHSGLLTYDGVHPTSPDGATMLANAHAGGILAALQQQQQQQQQRGGAPRRAPLPPPAAPLGHAAAPFGQATPSPAPSATRAQ